MVFGIYLKIIFRFGQEGRLITPLLKVNNNLKFTEQIDKLLKDKYKYIDLITRVEVNLV